MQFTEQPGRLIAIFIIGPYLLYKGSIFNDKLLLILGIIFIIYELFWVIMYDPKMIPINI